ncbi:hypothetical protein [uncultured Psychroserpens sp.]|uniref:hypothetical protein n=1 Tax=uncultured Psychroserpens sp. TaxID=255436 RepID=UPI002638DF1D|nr:hypothetical protein [uncultured Psychroserpens sp.]
MKTTIKLSIAIYILLFLCLGCKNDKQTVQNLAETTTSERTELCGFEGTPFKKIAPVAIAELNRYNTFYDDLVKSLPASESEHLILGVEITKIQELFDVACAVKDNPGSSLYVMNAIKEVKDEDGNITPVTDMIFVVVPPNSESPQVKNHYYNFTQPCPAACPKITGIDYPIK